MDLTRALLIGVIAVLSFMLLTEWTAFSQQQRAPSVAPAAMNSGGDTLPPREFDAPSPEPADASDIPAVPEMSSPSQVAEVATDTPAAGTDIVVVRTDVMQVTINLEGGDITEVALLGYPARIDTPELPFLLLEDNQLRTYVAQSGLIGKNGTDSSGRAQFSAPQREFSLGSRDQLSVALRAESTGDVEVIKEFTFNRGDFLIDVDYSVTNNSDERWTGNLFGQLKRDSSADPSAENSSGMGMVPFLGAATTLPDERFAKYDFDDMRSKPLKEQIPGGWIAMVQHYFLSAWVPNPEQVHTYSTRVTSSGFNIAGFVSPPLVVDPGQTGRVGASLYAGPKDQYRLAEISPYLKLTVDYGWLWLIANPLFWALIKIHSLVGNWGVAIILLTVAIKAAFFYFSAISYRSMANMRRVQPELVAIRERYADDKQKQSQEMMNLYKKEKINPLAGCLPILIQMPVFIALYWVLMESVELRQAPFFGWIEDLSVMDPYFVLPLIMGVSMWAQQKLSPPPPDPMQAKIMQWMPVVFTFFFLWFPAGLVLYWVTNNVLSIAQQWFITRQIEQAARKT